MNSRRHPVAAAAWLAAAVIACGADCRSDPDQSPRSHSSDAARANHSTDSTAGKDHAGMQSEREQMVERQLAARDIVDRRVLDAMRRVPRHRFVPAAIEEHAYDDRALPIGQGQTISQPYIVALMTQLAQPSPDSRALEIGTGSGYQAAVLAELVSRVYTIEILPALADQAAQTLSEMGYDNIFVRCGDGYQGWLEHAPFDIILVAAAAPEIPQPLIDQFARGGRLVIPVGTSHQQLQLLQKLDDGSIRREVIAPVAFVPMTGQARD
jgi:protein-L-isoaspartate(D-aspartate) O-methyltransferase